MLFRWNFRVGQQNLSSNLSSRKPECNAAFSTMLSAARDCTTKRVCRACEKIVSDIFAMQLCSDISTELQVKKYPFEGTLHRQSERFLLWTCACSLILVGFLWLR